MTAPIVIYRPALVLQPLDANGDPDGASVDVSCDMQSVELGVDTPTIEVSNFCGNYTLPDDISESASFGVAITEDTDTNWAALVGKTVEARVKDRTTDTRYRRFTTMILINPSLYGPTEPGEARAFEFDVPVLSSPEWVTEGSS